MSVVSPSVFGVAAVAWLFIGLLALFVVCMIGGTIASRVAAHCEARRARSHRRAAAPVDIASATPLALPESRA